jgi:hypothetical protein
MTHNRFNLEHIKTCDDCYNAYWDFLLEQNDEARLDNQGEQDDEESN